MADNKDFEEWEAEESSSGLSHDEGDTHLPRADSPQLIEVLGWVVGPEDVRTLLDEGSAVLFVGTGNPDEPRWEDAKRRRSERDDDYLQVGGLRIGIRERCVLNANKRVILSERELQMLILMARAPGAAVSFREFALEVWGDAYGDYRQNLRAAIGRLRTKLSKAHVKVRIESAPGFGFRLIAEPTD